MVMKRFLDEEGKYLWKEVDEKVVVEKSKEEKELEKKDKEKEKIEDVISKVDSTKKKRNK